MEFTALIANLGKHAAGIVAETLLSFPTTTKQVQNALQIIGVDGRNYEEIMVKEYSVGIAGVAPLLGEYAHIDELNYLARRLEDLSPELLQKFTAAVCHGEYVCSVQDLINLSYPCNLEQFIFLPEVQSYEDYGRFLVDTRRDFSLPKGARFYFNFEEYGETTAINENGDLTPQGYIFHDRSGSFQEIYDGKEIPREYRVFQYPVQTKVKRSHSQNSRDSPKHKRR